MCQPEWGGTNGTRRIPRRCATHFWHEILNDGCMTSRSIRRTQTPDDIQIDSREWLNTLTKAGMSLGGALLVYAGFARRSLFGLGIAGLGAYALRRALSPRRTLPIVP